MSHCIDQTTRVCTACGVPEQFINTKDCDAAAERALLARLKAHNSPTLDDLLERLERDEVKALMAAFGRYTIKATVTDLAVKRAREKARAQAA